MHDLSLIGLPEPSPSVVTHKDGLVDGWIVLAPKINLCCLDELQLSISMIQVKVRKRDQFPKHIKKLRL